MKKLILTVALVVATGSVMNANHDLESKKIVKKDIQNLDGCADFATAVAEIAIADYYTNWFGAYGWCIKQR